jgi:hypothetical protein
MNGLLLSAMLHATSLHEIPWCNIPPFLPTLVSCACPKILSHSAGMNLYTGACMISDPQRHHRRSIRLKGYNYAQEGA